MKVNNKMYNHRWKERNTQAKDKITGQVLYIDVKYTCTLKNKNKKKINYTKNNSN